MYDEQQAQSQLSDAQASMPQHSPSTPSMQALKLLDGLQLLTLETIGKSRTRGALRNNLTKDAGIEARNFHYVMQVPVLPLATRRRTCTSCRTCA